MSTPSSGQRASAIPSGLIGMLLLLAVVESYVERHNLDYTRTDYWDWRLSGHNARTRSRDCQVLCFGTSRIQQAIVPKVIEHQSGLKTWNLAMCWGQAPAAYFLLKRALDAGARPSSILVEYHPTALSDAPSGARGFWPELLNLGETLDLAWSARDATLFAATALGHNVPTIKNRSLIRDRIVSALQGGIANPWAANLTSIRNRNFNRGAFVMPKVGGFRGKVGDQYRDAFFGKSWWCAPVNASYIRRLLALASSKNIQVYWLLPPFAPELQEKRERANNVALYETFVRGWMAEFPNLTVLDAENSGYEPNVFFDAAHLDRQGALALSASVGEFLRSRKNSKSSDRWVKLPAYRDWAPSFRVEDIPMSQAYLVQIGTIRR
jgi:hypothetical protein